MSTTATDPNQIAAAVSFLKRTKTQSEIEAIAVTAFAALQDGKQITSVHFEGGGATAIVNFNPGDLLNACETALTQNTAQQTGDNTQNTRVVFPNFSPAPTQT